MIGCSVGRHRKALVGPWYYGDTPLRTYEGKGTALSDYEPCSLREKRAARAGETVVYSYGPISDQMKAQAFHALAGALGPPYVRHGENYLWKYAELAIMKEHGLIDRIAYGGTAKERVQSYVTGVQDTEQFLDAVELSFRVVQNDIPLHVRYGKSAKENDVREAIAELNRRFSQHDLGYAFSGWPGIITRLDSQYIHAEVVESAIHQLSAAGWGGPLDEFLEAHRHYRHGNHKAAMNDALKAFESTMKAILQAQQWEYQENWQAKNLIKGLFDNRLLPSSLESYFAGIRSILESGVPMLRNRQSGHGQGSVVHEVPEYMAAFTLHLTASNILFLLSAHAETPKTGLKS